MVEGWKIGTISFPGTHTPPISSDTQRPNIVELYRWYEFFRRQSFPRTTGSIYESPASAIFAVLEGIAPIHRSIEYQRLELISTGPEYSMKTYKHPPYKAPYDFSDRKDHFMDFMGLYNILTETFPPLTDEDSSQPQVVLNEAALSLVDQKIAGSRRANNYVQRMEESMTRDCRILFVADNSSLDHLWLGRTWIGSGPPHVEPGDEIFFFAGVTVPMVLRSVAGEEGYRVVGAVLVHGIMHTGEKSRHSRHITLL